MKHGKRLMALILTAIMAGTLCGCSGNKDSKDSSQGSPTGPGEDRMSLLGEYNQKNDGLDFDKDKWQYDADNNIYYQLGVQYCTDAAAVDYEAMGIYVPGPYMDAKENSDGTYTCTVKTDGALGNYTAKTAPVLFPINTPGYSAQAAPTVYNYQGLSQYLDAGMIYVYSGMRGRSNGYNEKNELQYSGGAPWGVTDLKAAIRYYRFNKDLLPGNTDSIFTFGMSGGGAQSALAGATGDSTLYFNYLTSIGAAMVDKDGEYISDAVAGSMCWCPITSLDYADEAYEWNMGQYTDVQTRSDASWTSALSDDLAVAYGKYINDLGIKDYSGNVLKLEESSDGIYTAGSYYDYLKGVIETSLNNFLKDTTFPYTPANDYNPSGNFGGGGNDAMADISTKEIEGRATGTPKVEIADVQRPDDAIPKSSMPDGIEGIPDGLKDKTGDKEKSGFGAVTYERVEDYIASLNSDTEWIKYDPSTNTAAITGIKDFVTHCKEASKYVPAFDRLDRKAAENYLFGNDDNDSVHFDKTVSNLLGENKEKYSTFADWDEKVMSQYQEDLKTTDKLGNTLEYRENMYNPMYYLCGYYEGKDTSTVAPYWRIRSGISQSDIALTVETNLALALMDNKNVKDVDFETVWGMQHTLAERTGDSTANFIEWVKTCTLNK